MPHISAVFTFTFPALRLLLHLHPPFKSAQPIMSSTSPSYIDDGRSFTRRMPPTSTLFNVSNWLLTTHGSPDTSSTHTGSYIDDGLDLVPATNDTTPGFGRIDAAFYKHSKRRCKNEEDGAWNDDIALAVSGDIQRSLAKLERAAGLEVRRAVINSKEKKGRSERGRIVVSVPAPLRWGTFVIKGDDGRVVVVDERGEYDSGAARTGDKRKKGKKWIEAARSPSPPVLESPPVVDNLAEGRASKADCTTGSRSKTRGDSEVKTWRTSEEKWRPRALSPVPESAYDSDDPLRPSTVSPTDFFMTGGLSGWPSPLQPSHVPPPEPPSPIVPRAITWDTSTSPYTYDSRSKSDSKSKSRSQSARTLPHGWPTQSASPTRSVCSSASTYLKPTKRGSSRRSSQSRTEQSSRNGHSNQEVGSNYQPPNIVEVTYDETPPGEVSYSQAGWNEGRAKIAQSWSAAEDEEKAKGSNLAWSGSAQKLAWADDQVCRKTGSIHKCSADERRSRDKHGDWDGFERPKTIIEVSIAGGSERSWPASQRSIHTVQMQRSYRSHTSRKSSRHSPTEWLTSHAASQASSAVHWGGSDAQSEQASAHGSERSRQNWSKSRHGSETSGPTKYKNCFDGDNAAYLNETRGGIPVGVAWPHKSVAGWD